MQRIEKPNSTIAPSSPVERGPSTAPAQAPQAVGRSALRRPKSLSNLTEWETQRLSRHSSALSTLDALASPPANEPRPSAPGSSGSSADGSSPAHSLRSVLVEHPATQALRAQAEAAASVQKGERYFNPFSTGTDVSGVRWAGGGGLAADRLSLGNASTAEASFNRNGVSGDAALTPGNDGLKLTAFQLAQASGLGVSNSFGLGDGNSVGLSATSLGGSGFGGGAVGLSLGHGTLVGHLGLIGLVSAEANLSVIEAYEGNDPARQGKLLVEWKQNSIPTFGFEVSGNVHTFGLGGRLLLSREKQAVYRLYLSPSKVGQILRQQDQRFASVSSGLTGLKLKKPPVRCLSVHDIFREESRGGFLIDEAVTLTVTDVGTAGLSAGAYGMRAGVFGTVSKGREITLARVSSTEVELTMAPVKTLSGSVNVEAALLSEAYVQYTHSWAQTHSMTFDLGQPAARESLKTLLSGNNVLSQVQFAPLPPKGSEGQATAPAAMLPLGVTSRFMEFADRPEFRVGAGLPSPVVPFTHTRVAGVGRHRVTAVETSVVVSESATLETQTFSQENAAHALHRGTSTTQASVTVYRSGAPNQQTSVNGIIAQISHTESRAVGNALNRTVRKKMGLFKGPSIAPFTRQGGAQAYSATVQRFISKDDVDSLAKASDAAVAREARVAGIDAKAFKRVLRSASSEDLSLFLSKQHGAALPAVHNLLGNNLEDLKVVTDTDAFTKPLRRASEMFVKFDPAAMGSEPGHLKKAIREARRNDRRLTKALHDANDDQVLRAFDADGFVDRLTEVGEARLRVRSYQQTLQARFQDTYTPSHRQRVASVLVNKLTKPFKKG
jgi:hypothetical protein